MRAVKSERLVPSGGTRGKAKDGKPAKRLARRRKPTPRWLRPTLIAGGALALAGSVAAGAYGAWRADYPGRALAWLDERAIESQIALGLTVQEVIARGREGAARDELLAALDIRRGQPILSFDLAAAKARLEAIGWVKTADVSRKLPHTIEIAIRERRPLALWQSSGRLALIGRDGEVITTQGLERFAALPVVVGPQAAKQAGALLALLREEPSLFDLVEAAVRVGDRRWNIRVKGGIEVRLPEGDERAAWHRLAALERNHRILARKLMAIDLRLPDRLIVRLPPGEAERLRQPGEKT